MSYGPTGLQMVKSGRGGDGVNIWYYVSADAHTDVDATDYFSDALERGMQVGDIVYVVNTSGYTATLHAVAAIDSDGNGTVSAAVLS